MKKVIAVMAVLAMAVMFSACSMSMDTVRYANGTDKNVQTAPCIITLAPEPAPLPVIPPKATRVNILQPVMFDWDKSDIRADQQYIIDKVAALMAEYPDTVLVLDGYASTEGTDEYNLNLSMDRVQAVEAALVAKGVPFDSIQSITGQGETSIFGEILNTNRRVMVLSVE